MGAANWRWVNESGAQFQLTDDELIGGLSSEAIPSYALVWRTGWGEWLPAMQVAELSWALPAGAADLPLRPKSATTHSVPSPPLERYGEFRHQAEARRQHSEPPYASFPPDGAAPESIGRRAEREADDDWEPLTQIHDPESLRRMSSFAQEAGFDDSDEVTNMLEDPSSLLPVSAAGAVSSSRVVSPAPPNSALGAPRPAAFTRTGSLLPPPDPNWRQRTGEHPAVAPPPPSTPTVSTFIPRAPAPPAGMRPIGQGQVASESSYPAPRRSRGVMVLGGIACGLAAAVVTLFFRGGFADGARDRVRALVFGQDDAPPPAAASAPMVAPSGAPVAVPPRPIGCKIQQAPRELAPWAHGSIPIELTATRDAQKIALAYAQAPHYAMGITVDPGTLDVERLHREYRKEPIFTVAPILAYGKLTFSAERQGARLAFSLTADAEPPFGFGRSQSGLAVLHQGMETQLAWPLAGGQETGLPAIAKTKDGFAVAIRLGGPKGAMALGYLDARGKPTSPLFESDTDRERISLRPSIAVKGDELVLAYAAAPLNSQGLRQIWLARNGVGKAPGKVFALELSGDDATTEVSHVQVATAGERNFIAQWTSGMDAQQVVRVQLLDLEMKPLGAAVSVGGDVGYSYAGSVWSDGKRVFSAYVQNNAGADQLWGATLRCE